MSTQPIPTPRTDAEVAESWFGPGVHRHVRADFARELERENADLLAALEVASLAIRDVSRQLADAGVQPTLGWQAFREARAAIAKAKGGDAA